MLGQIKQTNPAATVLVDYPGFNLRLAKALRARNFQGKFSSISALRFGHGIVVALRKWLGSLI